MGLGWFVEAVEDVGETFVEAVEDVGETFVEAVEDVGETFVEAVEDVGEVVVDVGGTVLDGALTVLDDTVFEVVDIATFGGIDLDYEDGNFGAQVGIDGVFDAGINLGTSGFGVDAMVLGQGAELAIDGDGFNVAAQVGVDFGPFPYVEVHAGVDEDGNFGIGGEATAYIPTPVGVIGGHVEGEYQQTDDGFELSGSAEGHYIAPTGMEAKGGIHASHVKDADGYHTEVGVEGEVGIIGGPHIGGSAEYFEGREGDVTYSGGGAEAHVSAPGVEVGASGTYTHVETPDGEFDILDGEAHATAGGIGVGASGQVVSGPDGTTTSGDVTFDGDAGDVAASALGATVDSFGGVGTSALLGDLVDGDGIGGLIGQAAGGLAPDLTEIVEDVIPEGLRDLTSGHVPDLGEIATEAVGGGAPDLTEFVEDFIPDDLMAPVQAITSLPDVSSVSEVAADAVAEEAADVLADSLAALNTTLESSRVDATITEVEEIVEAACPTGDPDFGESGEIGSSSFDDYLTCG